MPFASIWLGLGLALTSIIGNCRLTLKTCAVPGTQQIAEPDRENYAGLRRGLYMLESMMAGRLAQDVTFQHNLHKVNQPKYIY